MKLNIDKTIPVTEIALLSKAALAEDWNRPEGDEAWAHLQETTQSSFDFWDNPLDNQDWNNA